MTADVSPSPRPRRFRPGLRGLMILVVVVALPVGWPANTIRAQRRAIAAVRAANGIIGFDYDFQPIPATATSPSRRRIEPAAPRWLRRWLGDELFQQVETIDFNDRTSPAILASVAHFDHLRRLSLNVPSGRGDGSLHLQTLRRLEELDLAGDWLTDPILAEIAQIRSLRSLRLRQALATDEGFARLATLPALRELTISQNPHLTGAGMDRLLAGLPGLRHFELSGQDSDQPGPGRAVEALAEHCPDLASLGLGGASLGDDDLAMIGRLRELARLDLSSRRITDAGLAHLGSLQGLRQLSIRSPGLTAAGVAHLGGCAALEEVWLLEADITDAGLAHLAALPHLSGLMLGPSPGITATGMVMVGRLTNLRELSIEATPNLTDAGLIPLHGLPRLQDIILGRSGVTPAGVGALRRAVPTLIRIIIKPAPVAPAPTPAAK